MARGWESKSVEAQMEDAGAAPGSAPKRSLNDDEKIAQREHERLKLSRAYVLHQIESSTSERYRDSLRKALDDIEQRLAKLQSAG